MAMVALVLGSSFVSGTAIGVERRALVGQWRNFYGSVRVKQESSKDVTAPRLVLVHGRTIHGSQFVSTTRRMEPTTYFGQGSGAQLSIQAMRRQLQRNLRIGIVGLGVGTIASYGEPGDQVLFYEIDPRIIRLASGPDPVFTFMRDSRAAVEVVLGDARMSMERENREKQRPQLDILIIDAFSGDAIPVHLLTREAFEVYIGRLSHEGLLVFHISNRMLDLTQPIASAAGERSLTGLLVPAPATGDATVRSRWVVLGRNPSLLTPPELPAGSSRIDNGKAFRPWTDDYSSILRLML
jgi:hypothetical protein